MSRRTLIRAEKVYREIEKVGRTTSAAIAERLQVTQNELFYVLRKLRQESRVETVNLGRISLWCTSRAAAEEVLAKQTETLKSLLCGRGRFATPKEVLQFITEGKEVRKLFFRHTSLRPSPATMQIIGALMARISEKPIETSRGRVYLIQRGPQLRHCLNKMSDQQSICSPAEPPDDKDIS